MQGYGYDGRRELAITLTPVRQEVKPADQRDGGEKNTAIQTVSHEGSVHSTR